MEPGATSRAHPPNRTRRPPAPTPADAPRTAAGTTADARAGAVGGDAVRAEPGRADGGGSRADPAVGQRLRRLREERGLSLSALARAAGLGKATLSGLEHGTRNPTLETLYAVAGALGVPL